MLGDRLRAFTPWAGLVVGVVVWVLYQQVVTDALHFVCTGIGIPRSVAFGAFSTAIIGVAGIVSATRAPNESTRGFVGSMCAMAALVFALAVLLQTIAVTIVSPCVR